MKRVAGIAGAMLFAMLFAVPVALAADPLPTSGRVLISTSGDVSLAAGDQADFILVTGGTATIKGTVNALVVINGSADLTGATAETIIAVRSPVTLGPGTVVRGDVRTLDSLVLKMGNAEVQGSVRDLTTDLVAIGAVMAPAMILLWAGFALATIVAGLVLAALAARQLRAAEQLLSREPGMTIVAGIAGLILPPIVAVIAIATIIGAPLGIGLLIFAWPLAAFVGYVVAAVWIGEWILRQASQPVIRERPYLAVVIGVIALQVLSIIPPLPAIASLFGFGAVLLLTWRTFRGSRGAAAVTYADAATGG